jgi:hypothetical protein
MEFFIVSSLKSKWDRKNDHFLVINYLKDLIYEWITKK